MQHSGKYEGYGFITFETQQSVDILLRCPMLHEGELSFSFKKAERLQDESLLNVEILFLRSSFHHLSSNAPPAAFIAADTATRSSSSSASRSTRTTSTLSMIPTPPFPNERNLYQVQGKMTSVFVSFV